MRRFLIAGLAGSSILLAWRFQQDSPQRAAEQVMRQVIDAHNRMQWARIVTLLHPAAVADLAREAIAGAQASEERRLRPPPIRPNLPPCVAEYFEKERTAYTSAGASVLRHYGVSSLDEMRSLSREELAARLLEGRDVRAQALEAMKLESPAPIDSLKRRAGDR